MWLTQLARECWNILAESAPFILVGFAIAAVLHVLMTRGNWARWLKGLGTRSVLLASAVGLPLPLCSCSVLPAAVSLRKNGASKGATLSFLISTPETSVQSVLFTYALLGPVMAIFRPIASAITAIVAGITENFFERRFPEQRAASGDAPATGESTAGGSADERSCCGHQPAAPATEPADDCCSSGSDDDQPATIRAGFRHAFIDVFDDVVGWMLLGVLVAASIQVFVPDILIQAVFGPPLQAMLIMLVIGVPLYVCAEASTPIAAALILQGVSPGAALVFLLAGPATNIGAVGLLDRQLGRRTVVIYLTTIAIVSVTLGLILDWFFGARGVNLAERAMAEPLLPRWLKNAGAGVFLLLCARSAIRLRAYTRLAGVLDWLLPVRVTTRRLTVMLAIGAVTGYGLSGFVMIEPGQVGMLKRFGKVVRADAPPGLHFVGPYPIGSVDRVDTEWVDRVELGYAPAATEDEQAADDRSWVLLGDENIANIRCAAHWRMTPGDTRAFAYAASDRAELVRVAVQSALRAILGNANIETIFTTDQRRRGAEIHARAQAALDRAGCGIEIVAFDFLDLHAPPQVHDAFRDIASALEDRAMRRNQALTRKAEIEPLARGTREKLTRNATADALRRTTIAGGEANTFLAKLAAYREYPGLTRARLLFEMYDRILPGTPKCIRPTGANVQLDLRFGGAKSAPPADF
jgi:uncharacterized membrane protein YraQ (UPF0718 family)/regulator of protease activity HflC (stomatin/prohibitin superfamily)